MAKKTISRISCETTLAFLDEKGPGIKQSELIPEIRGHLEACPECKAYFNISSSLGELGKNTGEVRLYSRFLARNKKIRSAVWRPYAAGAAAVLAVLILTFSLKPVQKTDLRTALKTLSSAAAVSSVSPAEQKGEKEYNEESSDLEYYTEMALEI